MTSLTLRILSTNSLGTINLCWLLRGHWGWKDVRGINSMSKQDEYRDSAAQMFELAARAQAPMTNPTCWTSLKSGSTWRIEVGTRQRAPSKSIRW